VIKFRFGITQLLILIPLGLFAQQDCFDAINVCFNNYTQTSSFVGVGSIQEVAPGSSCLGNGEINSAWYTFTVTSAGNLEFQLNPLNPNDDYDFALYNISTDSCNGIQIGTNQPVSCNYSADQGPTGLSSSGSGNNNGSSNSNQNAPVAVQIGETYVLLVSNFTASQSGYSLDFAGTASIGDAQSPSPDFVDLKEVCNPSQVYLFFDEDLDCSSLSGDGSEITITGPSVVSVQAVNGVGCGGRTDQIRIKFTGKIQAVGTYAINITSGSDGNSFLDGCGNEIPSGTSINFDVDYIGPDVSIINVSHTNCGGNQGSAEANVTFGTAPFSFVWNSSPNQVTAVATDLEPGSYRVIVTDANGCKEKATVNIQNNSPIDLSNYSTTSVTCNGLEDGSAQITPNGGVLPYNIEWQTNPVQTGQTATNLQGGNVDVIVTDDTGCEEIQTIHIPFAAGINLPTTTVNPDCGLQNGSATVTPTGGNGGFTFLWSTNPAQTSNTATNLMAGIYSVTVEDQNGCSETTEIILTDNFAPNATIESRVPDCGQGVGEATAIATSGTAPFQYLWNTVPPQNNATATGLSEGDYFVTISDANSCVQIINVKIDSVAPPELSTTLTQPDCGESNGTAIANVTSGLQPFTYSWSSSNNSSNSEGGLADGTYTVEVTDSIGCTDSETFNLEQLPPLSSFDFSNVCDGEEMSFTANTTSGATIFTWSFGDGNSSDQEFPSYTYDTPGQYQVTLILEGGCMNDTVTETVNVYEPPTAEFIIDPEVVTTRTQANFIYTGNGGSSFLWNFGDGEVGVDQSPEHLFGMDGFYDISLLVTDDNGCTDTTSQTIEVLLQPVIFLPNAFMPEGTPENSRFKGYGIGIITAELSVYDRWGTLLYFSNDLNEITIAGWDGN